MKRLFGLALFLCLLLAAPAHGKEVLAAKVCGDNGCVTSRDRDLIAALAEGGNPVDPPKTAAPFFRVRLTVGDEKGDVQERFWMHFMPKGELIRGSDGTWMPAPAAYTDALKKVVNPSMEAYPASRLERLLAGDRPQQAQPPSVTEPSRSQRNTGGGVGGSAIAVAALAVALLLLFAVWRRRRVVAPPGAA